MRFSEIDISYNKCYWVIIAFVGIIFLFGCSESQDARQTNPDNTGAINFSLVWSNASGDIRSYGISPRALTDDVCVDFGVTDISVIVKRSSDHLQVASGNFACDAHTGTITGVSPGQMYVVIEGYVGGVDAYAEWRGLSSNILVEAGQTNTNLQDEPVVMNHQSDEDAPTIVARNPAADATDVAPNASVIVEFSEALSPTTIDSNSFFISDTEGNPVPGNVSYNAEAHIAQFDPTADLNSLQTYTVTVVGGSPAGVFDMAGNPLAATSTWDFTTSGTTDTTPPTVTDHDPVGDSIGEGASILVAFNEPMNPDSISVTTFLVNNGSTNIAGSISYQADNGAYTNVATFDPLGPLDVSTVYTITIVSGGSGVKDLAGNPLQTDYSWSFTTTAAADTTPPTVTDHTPMGTSVAANTSIQVTFSEAMNPDSITNQTFLVNDGITNIAGSVSYVGDVATFDPLADLEFEAVYSVTIVSGASGVMDLAGNPLANDYHWSFTTVAPLSEDLIWDQGNWDQKNWN